jgi:hypothetical protein
MMGGHRVNSYDDTAVKMRVKLQWRNRIERTESHHAGRQEEREPAAALQVPPRLAAARSFLALCSSAG